MHSSVIKFILANIFVCHLFLNAFAGSTNSKAATPFNPKKGDHIIILGNTFADRMRFYGQFEGLLHKSFPSQQLVVRNMGWSADEPALQPRPFNFPNLHDDLQQQKADIIFLCFGMNESFKGISGIRQFEKDLLKFCNDLKSHQYNGLSAPQLILVSPIAHEDLGGHFPKPEDHNINLALYTKAMQQVASQNNILFIDLFTPSRARMKENHPQKMTINGIHLNREGYFEVGQWMIKQLGYESKLPAINTTSDNFKKLIEVVKMKNDHFMYRWRAVNGAYIYGERKEPFGVKTFPPEFEKLDAMTAQLDKVVWEVAQGNNSSAYSKALSIVDENYKSASAKPVLSKEVKTKKSPVKKTSNSMHEHGEVTMEAASETDSYPASTAQFSLPAGFEINLFASEKDFPIEKPVYMTFDPKGRLWVATIPSYPQYTPGSPAKDKILILEDTDHDGKADKHTVFADNLYLPLSFEFGDGGIYVSQEPDIIFLKDTNGDDKADSMEVVLSGFGSEDSHHAIHSYTYGQDGALYFNEGMFTYTQVETPYGPVRSYNAAIYRYEPRTGKFSNYISYNFWNPWGNLFDYWGTNLISDASDGKNYFAPPLTGKIDYPAKHPHMKEFNTTIVRPTSGIEIISSRHFPDELQGNMIINNNIGFQGIKQHKIIEEGSGITTKEVEPMLQSSDPNFRPVDLKFGPDGALYLVDWFNPLIGHMQYSLRDPRRDKAHGRIWRITNKNKPLLKPVDISKQSVPQLLDNLMEYEDRFRYRTRTQLRKQDPQIVLNELPKWINKLDKNHPFYEHNLLEALWIYQDFDVVNEELLGKLLNAKNPHARAAATKALVFWRGRVKNSLKIFKEKIQDESMRVRLEALVALSFYDSEDAVLSAVYIHKMPTDYYINYAAVETIKALKPVWMKSFKENESFLSNDQAAVNYLLGFASAEEAKSLPKNETVLNNLLSHDDIEESTRLQALNLLAEKKKINSLDLLLATMSTQSANTSEVSESQKALVNILLNWNKTELKANKKKLLALIENPQNNLTQEIAFASLITAEGNDKSVWKLASKNEKNLSNYLSGLSLLTDKNLQSTFYEKVKSFTNNVPERLQKSGSDSNPPFKQVHTAAVKALATQPGNTKEKIAMLGSFVKLNSPYLNAALAGLLSLPVSDLNQGDMPALMKNILAVVENTPEEKWNDEAFRNAVSLGKKVADLLPAKEAKKAKFVLESTGTFNLTINTIPSKMLFDRDTIVIPAGRSIFLYFTNPDEMPHNLVVIKPGSLEKVGTAADAMVSQKDGFEKNFVPSMPEVLHATRLLNRGEWEYLWFKAPTEPGDYPFICSFPGHWRMMKGILKVVNPKFENQD